MKTFCEKSAENVRDLSIRSRVKTTKHFSRIDAIIFIIMVIKLEKKSFFCGKK